jgi:hypothetical protein
MLHHPKLYKSFNQINLHYSFHLVNERIYVIILIPKVNCSCWFPFANLIGNSNLALSTKYLVIVTARGWYSTENFIRLLVALILPVHRARHKPVFGMFPIRK